jgi:nifR3 family TIM-barrel protein
MHSGFWKKLKRPIMAMAPMSGVSDEAFRLMFLKYGKPSVFWTEFVSADGLFSRGKDYCLEILKFNKKERPIVAQVFGGDPVYFEKAAEVIAGLGFDGIDINMGCPDRDIEKRGGGAALINNPELAKEIIRAVKRGALRHGSGQAGKIPVSIKTRIGYSKNQIAEWVPVLLEEKPAAITVHFRTRQELSAPPAHWELAKEILKLRDKISPETLILGNGDVKSLEEAKKLVKETGLDGIMFGRGLLGNPWFFLARRSLGEGGAGWQPSISERLNAIVEHAGIFSRLNGSNQFDSMKKHFHAYTKGFRGAKDLREQLMKVKNAAETKKVIENFLEGIK